MYLSALLVNDGKVNKTYIRNYLYSPRKLYHGPKVEENNKTVCGHAKIAA